MQCKNKGEKHDLGAVLKHEVPQAAAFFAAFFKKKKKRKKNIRIVSQSRNSGPLPAPMRENSLSWPCDDQCKGINRHTDWWLAAREEPPDPISPLGIGFAVSFWSDGDDPGPGWAVRCAWG
jgi:hypothetical protein